MTDQLFETRYAPLCERCGQRKKPIKITYKGGAETTWGCGASDCARNVLVERDALREEVTALRAALEAVAEKYRRSSDSWHPGRGFPTEASKNWHDGYVTALAECALKAKEGLDPEGWAEHEADWRVAAHGTDAEWFARTGNCGHCGNPGGDCVCTADDQCGCGPHEPRTWPVACWMCSGTGKVDPRKPRALAVGSEETR